MGRSANRAHRTPRPDHPGSRGSRRRAAGSAPGKTALGQFLRIAIGLSAALGELHGQGLIHKDIKPAHALVESSTGQAWLTGFGIALRLRRERQPPEPPESIAGTLAHVAPEQTGRMNRSIDSRSDLYSLGVTLYAMLTGTLPFAASDPMEWVHHRAALQPLLAGLHVDGGEPPPVRPARARADAPATADTGRPWQRCAGPGGPSPAAWYTGGTAGPKVTKRGRNAL